MLQLPTIRFYLFSCLPNIIIGRACFLSIVSFFIFMNPINLAAAQTPSSPVNPRLSDWRLSLEDDKEVANLVVWGDTITGGANVTRDEGDVTRTSLGLYFQNNPSMKTDYKIGVNYRSIGDEDSFEIQGTLGLTNHVSVGGGYLARENGEDIPFLRGEYKKSKNGVSYVVAPTLVKDSTVKAGIYAAAYSDQYFASVGSDGEQRRALLAFIAPKGDGKLRPAAELFYVDPTIGKTSGAQFLFVNASIQYRGGFLSSKSRLGRALGPQGTHYGNPLSYLSVDWNRAVDVWEIGGLANFRMIKRNFPNGVEVNSTQFVAFPIDLLTEDKRGKRIFVGYQYDETPARKRNAALFGLAGKNDKVWLNLVGRYDFENESIEAVVGFKLFAR